MDDPPSGPHLGTITYPIPAGFSGFFFPGGICDRSLQGISRENTTPKPRNPMKYGNGMGRESHYWKSLEISLIIYHFWNKSSCLVFLVSICYRKKIPGMFLNLVIFQRWACSLGFVVSVSPFSGGALLDSWPCFPVDICARGMLV